MRTLEGDRDRLQAKLETEQGEAEAQRRARAKAEREVGAAQEQAGAELEAQKQQFEALLNKAKAEQVGHGGEERLAVYGGQMGAGLVLSGHCSVS